MRTLSLALALSLMSCSGPRTERPDSTPQPAGSGERMAGVVRVVGSAPVNVQVVLQPEQGRSVQLTGPLREELQQLSGVEVAVTGAMSSSPDPIADRQIRVTSYEILAVDGQPVVSGTVEGVSNGWTLLRTASGELVYLAGAPAEMRAGQKVWVQGPRAAIVQTYGVLKR